MSDELEILPRKIGRPALRADEVLGGPDGKFQIKRFRVSKIAWDKLHSQSRATGKTIPAIMRDLIDEEAPSVAAIPSDPLLIARLNTLGAELRQLHKELHPIGNNANQMTHLAHNGRGHQDQWRAMAAEIEAVLPKYRTAIAAVEGLLDQLLQDDDE